MILLKGFDEAVKRKGIKIKDVSEMMGLEYSALYRKRTGERRFSLNDVLKLTEILGCSIQELVYGFDVNTDGA